MNSRKTYSTYGEEMTSIDIDRIHHKMGLVRKHDNPETREQMSTVLYVRAQYPDVLMTMSPAGVKFGGTPKQRMIQGANMKRLGYLPGTADLMIFRAKKGFNGLFLELKSRDGRVSEEQVRFKEKAEREGYCYKIAYGSGEAIRFIDEYLT